MGKDKNTREIRDRKWMVEKAIENILNQFADNNDILIESISIVSQTSYKVVDVGISIPVNNKVSIKLSI